MDFLEIGKIVKPHGLKGRMKVLSYIESGDLLKTLDHVYIRRRKDETDRFTLKSLQPQGRCFYLEMEGIEGVDQAQEFVGSSVCVSADKLEKLPEGEYYWQELIGLEVITEEGNPVGILQRIFPTGSNDVYVCGEGKKEIFLPAIEEVVRKIDVERGMMVVRLPEGL